MPLPLLLIRRERMMHGVRQLPIGQQRQHLQQEQRAASPVSP